MRGAGVAATALVAGLGVGTAGRAGADGPTTTSFTAATQSTFTVPAGVQRIDVVATGARGGANSSGNSAEDGQAAVVTGTIRVHPLQVVYVTVGGTGDGTTGAGGFNGGGAISAPSANICKKHAGPGGGASDVRTLPRTDAASAASRLIVAGGGGGAGSVSSTNTGDAGDGGDADAPGESSPDGPKGGRPGSGGLGGDGGAGTGLTNAAPYAAGSNANAVDGGRGGLGVYDGTFNGGCGGGGGGGYGGGGGGGAGYGRSAGAGGGGGGSLDPDGGEAPTPAPVTVPASVVLRYSVLHPAQVTVALDPPSIKPDGTSTTLARATVTDGAGVGLEGLDVGITSSDGEQRIGPIAEVGDGVYQAVVTASAGAGTSTITADATDGTTSASGAATLRQENPPDPPPPTTPESTTVTTTAPAPPPPPPVTTTVTETQTVTTPAGVTAAAPDPIGSSPKVALRAIRRTGRRLTLALRCQGAPRCAGTLRVSTPTRRTLGTRRFAIASGNRSITLMLPEAAARSVKRGTRVRVAFELLAGTSSASAKVR